MCIFSWTNLTICIMTMILQNSQIQFTEIIGFLYSIVHILKVSLAFKRE